ncbi:MAG TPA: hypothetical protein VKF42_09325 [Chitinivibrionales bacterium]|jgi:hypothetical protein|nr:hypothetical protein [Chitinivibrionales bacterium]
MKKSMAFAIASALCAMTFLGFSCGNPTSVKTPIAITKPVAGQKAAAGDTLLVAWTQPVAGPKISYNYNIGAGWQQFASVVAVDNYSAKAVLPISSYTDSFQIMVEDNGNTYAAGTSAPFSVKYIVITYPAAGQTLTVGSTVTMTWKDTPAKLSSLRIRLSTDGGKSFGEMFTHVVQPTTLDTSWVIGSEPGATFAYPSSNCVLRIQDYTNDQLFDVTGTFSVQ